MRKLRLRGLMGDVGHTLLEPSFQRNSRSWVVLALLLSSYGWNMMLPAGVKRLGPGFAFLSIAAFRNVQNSEWKDKSGNIKDPLIHIWNGLQFF